MLATLALCLVTHLEPSHFAGALTDEGVKDLSQVPVSELTKEQLNSEYERLAKYRTEFIGPTVMAGAGALVLVIGGVVGLAGIVYSFLPSVIGSAGTTLGALSAVGFVLIGLGAVAIVVGGIFLAIGLVKLFPALARRSDAMQRRSEIEKRLEGFDASGNPLPPPVPPGVDTKREGPLPSLRLATF